MALTLACSGCHTIAFVDCTCPEGWPGGQLGHVTAEMAPKASQITGTEIAACPAANPDAALVCPPGSGCCEIDHDHAAAAACPQEGHDACGPGVDGCNVCRPITIIAPPGSAEVRTVNQFAAGG